MKPTDIPEIAHLTIPEKILFVEALWDTFAEEEGAVPVPQGHLDELDRRWAAHEESPGSLLTWEELWSHVDARRK